MKNFSADLVDEISQEKFPSAASLIAAPHISPTKRKINKKSREFEYYRHHPSTNKCVTFNGRRETKEW